MTELCFFFVDNEPAGSPDESPAGQIYEEIAVEGLRAFDTRQPRTSGQQADRWGTWVTAWIPLVDPDTNQLVAVLGMDVDAADWNLAVAGRCALPLGLTLILLIVLGAAVAAGQRVDETYSLKPVQRRLLVPLVVTLFFSYWRFRRRNNEDGEKETGRFVREQR